MTRTEAVRLVRERWERLGIPEEFPHVFSSDVDNMLEELPSTGNILDVQPTYHTSRGGNSNGLHVAQGSAPESDRHSAISELDGEQKRNGCVAQMDMPRNDAPPADESSASAVIKSLDVDGAHTSVSPLLSIATAEKNAGERYSPTQSQDAAYREHKTTPASQFRSAEILDVADQGEANSLRIGSLCVGDEGVSGTLEGQRDCRNGLLVRPRVAITGPQGSEYQASPADSRNSTPLYLLASEIVDVVTKGYEQ